MDQQERLGSAHECLSDLLYAIDPRILIRIACVAGDVVVGELVEVVPKNPRVELPGLVKRAQKHFVDLVFAVQSVEGKVLAVWVFEIQLSKDYTKLRRWDVYPVAFGLEHDATGYLALFVPDPGLRVWIRKTLFPRMKLKPIMIEPDQIERIADREQARRRPELTILGCLYHVHEPALFEARVEVFRTAWWTIQRLADRPSQRYAALVMSLTPPAVFERGIAELREAGDLDEDHFELVSDCERLGYSFHRGRSEGLAEGEEAGLAKGMRRALRRFILDLLELRGVTVTAAQREQVETCESLETLERWYAAVKAATTAQTVDELLD